MRSLSFGPIRSMKPWFALILGQLCSLTKSISAHGSVGGIGSTKSPVAPLNMCLPYIRGTRADKGD